MGLKKLSEILVIRFYNRHEHRSYLRLVVWNVAF